VALTRARERLYVTGTLRGKFENAMTKASVTTRGNRYDILFGNNYLSWILAAYQEHGMGEFPCIFQHIPLGGVQMPASESENDILTPHSATPLAPNDEEQRMAEVLIKRATYQYPLDFLAGLPTKVAASKLRGDLLDLIDEEDVGEAALEAQIQLMQAATPPFENLLADRVRPSATDIGTATHSFLEFCDYEALFHGTVEDEIERLVKNGFLSASAAEIINKEQLTLFLNSDLLSLIRSAKRIRREQKFSIYIPFAGLTADRARAEQLRDQKLFVQGSIDLILEMEDGSRILVDYKTDRITEHERSDRAALARRMTEAHGTQLACYRRAMEHLLGSPPDRTCIYSLPLGALVDVDVSEHDTF
jgi:ATP-dependent exoDNAse (exonuclease V) beta subunit